MSQFNLTQGLTNIAVNPTTNTPLSTNGQPTETINLVQYLPYPIIGFTVPQGVQYTLGANPVIQFKLYTTSAGTTQIAPGDKIVLYSKAPSDSSTDLGTKIAEAPYRAWWEVQANLQGVQQFASGLQFPVETAYTFPPNYTLVVAIATLISGETFNWTASQISIPVNQTSSQF